MVLRLLVCVAGLVPSLRLGSFESLVAHLASEAGYSVEMPASLASRPVVYYFGADEAAKDRLTGLAKNLFLTATFDADKKVVRISRNPAFKILTRRERVLTALTKLRQFMSPYEQYSARQLSDEAARFRGFFFGAQDAGQRREFGWKQLVLDAAATTRGQILVQTLLNTSPDTVAGILAAPCTRANHLTMSRPSEELADLFFAGKGVEDTDYANPASMEANVWKSHLETAEALRDEAIAVGQGRPQTYFLHPGDGTSMTIMVKSVSATKVVYLAGYQLGLPPAWQGAIEPQRNFEGFDVPFDLKMWVKEARWVNLNAFGGAAIKLHCNYAGWFTSEQLPLQNSSGKSLRAYFSAVAASQARGAETFRAKRNGDWLQIVDYGDPWPECGGDWRAFDGMHGVVEDQPLTQRELSEKLEGLDEKTLSLLEELMPGYAPLSQRYYGITGGIRLLRAVLRDSGAAVTVFDKKLRELSKPALHDVLRFFDGPYVWNDSSSLLHPDNVKNWMDVRLKAWIADKLLRFELVFPPELFRLPEQADFKFEVPIAP